MKRNGLPTTWTTSNESGVGNVAGSTNVSTTVIGIGVPTEDEHGHVTIATTAWKSNKKLAAKIKAPTAPKIGKGKRVFGIREEE